MDVQFSDKVITAFACTALAGALAVVCLLGGIVMGNFGVGFVGSGPLAVAAISAVRWMELAEREALSPSLKEQERT